MSGKTKVLIVVLVVLAAGAAFFFWKSHEASKETDRITSLQDTPQTAASVEKALSGEVDFEQAHKAIQSSDLLGEDKQLELLAKQLDNESAGTRMAAAVELMKLHLTKGSAKAGEALAAAATKEADPDVRSAIQAHLAQVELNAAPADARFATLGRLAVDQRPGYRLLAAQELGKLATPEAKALLGTLAKDADELVQITAESALEEDEEGGADDE